MVTLTLRTIESGFHMGGYEVSVNDQVIGWIKRHPIKKTKWAFEFDYNEHKSRNFTGTSFKDAKQHMMDLAETFM